MVGPAGSPLSPWLMMLVPVVGGLLVGLMAYYGSDKIRGHGIPEAIEAILLNGARVDPKVAVLKPLSAAIAIGSGGPFGAEGPIIMTGGAFGSLVAQWLKLTDAERTTLLVAGAAAGMSATFAAPMAAILLAVELLLFEWRPRSLVPVAVASVMAGALRIYWLGPGPLFPVTLHSAIHLEQSLLVAAPLGIVVGFASAGLSRLMYGFEDGFEHFCGRCACTGCGGRRSAGSASAWAGSSFREDSAWGTTISRKCCAGMLRLRFARTHCGQVADVGVFIEFWDVGRCAGATC